MKYITLAEKIELKELSKIDFKDLSRAERKRYMHLFQLNNFEKQARYKKFMKYFKKNYTIELTPAGERRLAFETKNCETLVDRYFTVNVTDLKNIKACSWYLFENIQTLKKAGYIVIKEKL